MDARIFIRALSLLSLIIFSWSLQGCSSWGDREIDLRGKWQFTIGDNMKFADPNYDDSDWERVYVPNEWEDEGFRNYDGYAWYRVAFDVDFDIKNPVYLNLGRIDDADEVYLNGHLIGKTGGFPPEYFTAYNLRRSYYMPSEYLKENGPNIIAVRIYDEGGEGGILGGDVGIYRAGEYTEDSYHLIGNWKFHLFDDKAWADPNLDDSEWEDIIVPGSWETQGFRDYDGFAWYRKRFVLPASFQTRDLALIMGKIDDMDEVYINGELVGFTGNIEGEWAYNNEYDKSRTYFIPDGVLIPGKENVIAVRVYDQQQRGGIYRGPITLIPANQYKDFWRRYRDDNYSFGEWIWTYWND